jgi:hypothetical protein
MLRHARKITLLVAAAIFAGCATPSNHPGFRPEEFSELSAAIRKVTSSPIKYCTRLFDENEQRVPEVYILTENGKQYSAVKIRGKWNFRETVFVG